MYFGRSPKNSTWGRLAFSGCILLSLLLLSTLAQPSNAQTKENPQSLTVGVNVGDQFSFKILHSDILAYAVMNNLVTFTTPKASLNTTDLQFQIKITGITKNDGNESYTLCFITTDGCDYYEPVVQFTITSGGVTHTDAAIYPGPYVTGLIVTNDWAFLKQHAVTSYTNRYYIASLTTSSDFQTQGDNTFVTTNTEATYNKSAVPTNFIQENGERMTATTKSIYNTQNGVLNYVTSTRTSYYENGTTSSQSFEVINTAYSGNTDFTSNSPSLPFYLPIFMLIPIVSIKKRSKVL